MLLNEQDLKPLARNELQKLARTFKVKANAKSVLIIKDLLTRFPEGVPCETATTSGNAKLAPKVETPIPTLPKTPETTAWGSNRTPPKTPTRTTVRRSTHVVSELSSSPLSSPPATNEQPQPSARLSTSTDIRLWPPKSRHSPRIDDPIAAPDVSDEVVLEASTDPVERRADEDAMSSASGQTNVTYRTPVSSRANSPEPPASPTVLRHTVETIRQVAHKDTATHKKVEELRSLGEHLTDKATLLQDVLIREREQRHRILSFLLYYVSNNNRWGTGRVQNGELLPENVTGAIREEYLRNGGRNWKDDGTWTFEEVWGGRIRMAPSLDTSEDRLSNWEEVDEVEEEEYLDNYEAAKALGRLPQQTDLYKDPMVKYFIEDHFERTNHGKRRASESEAGGQDDARYQARRRISEFPTSRLVGIQKPDKGKQKMSAAEVERMENERRSEMGATQDAADAEQQEVQQQLRNLDLPLTRKLAQDKARGHQDLVVRGAILKVATDTLKGLPVDGKQRKVLYIGLDRLGIMPMTEAAQLENKVLAEIALANLQGKKGIQ
ncbi:hypothetical protein WG66_000490 [Moniliophthora roreri]|uniref:Uncharacterized protein n=1 Tax=Moniliophthora roreri TaxID=221103 RepID=A0A0W0F142_MONRR|nr:hypothetical protein WG66_000490 [Moniliophthora roreri]